MHRNTLFRHNEIWKTRWRELQSGEEYRAEKKILPHPLDKYASDQAKMSELVTMRGIYDRTPEGVTKEDFSRILKWVATQAKIKREQEEERA